MARYDIAKAYTDDDLYQLCDLLSCAVDDLEDNLIFWDYGDSERNKVLEYVKTKINKSCEVLANYLTRRKYNV